VTGTSHGDQCKFMISRWIFLRTKSVPDKIYRANQNTFLVQ